jgi:hypothetical protein
MSSALACLGLAVSGDDEFSVLLKHALTGIHEVGTFGGVLVGRWQDDSGAALTLGLHDGQVADLTFGYAGTSGGLLADCRLPASRTAVQRSSAGPWSTERRTRKSVRNHTRPRAVAPPSVIDRVVCALELHVSLYY